MSCWTALQPMLRVCCVQTGGFKHFTRANFSDLLLNTKLNSSRFRLQEIYFKVYIYYANGGKAKEEEEGLLKKFRTSGKGSHVFYHLLWEND